MANVTFDGSNKLIIVNNGITSLSVKTDIYGEWKLWVLDSDNAKYEQAFRVIGGDEIGGGIFVDGTYFLLNGWRIRPYEGNHVLSINGNLYVDGGGSVVVQTVGNYNVLVNLVTSNIVSLVTVATGSGVTPQDKTDIATAVKNTLGTDFAAIPGAIQTQLDDDFSNIPSAVHTALQEDFDLINGTLHNLVFVLSQSDIDAITLAIYNNLSPDLNIIKGLVQHNFRFANQTYATNGKLLTGVIKIYPTSLDVENNTNTLSSYSVTADYDSSGNLIDYKVTAQ